MKRPPRLGWDVLLLALAVPLACGGRTQKDSKRDRDRSASSGGNENWMGGAPGEGVGGTATSGSGGRGGTGAVPQSTGGDAAGGIEGSGGAVSAAGGTGGTGSSGAGGAAESTGGSGPRSTFPCMGSYYDVDPDPEYYRCLPWTTCQPGTRAAKGGSLERDRECEPCKEGTYSEAFNQPLCESWRPCVLGMSVDQAGTSSSDAVCAPGNGPFAATPLGDVDTPRFTATAEGIYATVDSASLLRMSFDGKNASTFSVSSIEGDRVQSLVGQGSYVYVVGKQEPGDGTTPGFFAKFDADGNQVWRKELTQAVAWSEHRVASDGTSLYVSRIGHPYSECINGYCIPESGGQVFLAKYDSDGNLDWEITFENTSITGLAVADELVHISLARDYGSTVHRYDLLGDFVDEYFPEEENVWFSALQADPLGGVAMLDASSQNSIKLHRFEGADAPRVVDLLSGNNLTREMLVTEDHIYLGGGTGISDSDAALMVWTRYPGGIMTRTPVGSSEYDAVTGIVQGPDGQVFFGGITTSESERYLFIQPWP